MTRPVKVFSPHENFPNFCWSESSKLVIVIGCQVRYGQLMTDKAQVKAILHGVDGDTREIDLEGPPFQRTIEGNWFYFPNEELLYRFDHREGQAESALEQHYDFRGN